MAEINYNYPDNSKISSEAGSEASLYGRPGTSTLSRLKPKLVPELSSERNILRPKEHVLLSRHPVNKDFKIKIIPTFVDPYNQDERIGFGVWNNLIRKMVPFGRTEIHQTTIHYPNLSEDVFRQSMRRGLLFTKLELNGSFFSEAYLCPTNVTTGTDFPPILLPNLKYLIIRFNLTATLKGSDKEFNTIYIEKHHQHFRDIWSRASWNLWYILKTLTSMKLYSVVLEDHVKWENMIGFRQNFEGVLNACEEPLWEFIQRNGTTLKSLKLLPAILNEGRGRIKDNCPLPKLEELRFSGKMAFEVKPKLTQSKKVTYLMNKITHSLKPWRQFWETQFKLKKLEWICNKYNPWTITRKDFIRLCKMNESLESIVVTLHGMTDLLKTEYKIKKPPKTEPADLLFDCQCIQGVQKLKTFAISCFEDDATLEKIRIFNLNLLPKRLENVHLYGVPVLASELEHLASLPRLKHLSIMQPTTKKFSSQEELNGNIDGVTVNALKKISNIRTLQQLAVTGFPTKIEDENGGFVQTQPINIPGPRTPETIIKETTAAVNRNETILIWLKDLFNGAATFCSGYSPPMTLLPSGCVGAHLDVKNVEDKNANQSKSQSSQPDQAHQGQLKQYSYSQELDLLLNNLKDAGSVFDKEIYAGKNVQVVTIGDVDIPFDSLFYF